MPEQDTYFRFAEAAIGSGGRGRNRTCDFDRVKIAL